MCSPSLTKLETPAPVSHTNIICSRKIILNKYRLLLALIDLQYLTIRLLIFYLLALTSDLKPPTAEGTASSGRRPCLSSHLLNFLSSIFQPLTSILKPPTAEGPASNLKPPTAKGPASNRRRPCRQKHLFEGFAPTIKAKLEADIALFAYPQACLFSSALKPCNQNFYFWYHSIKAVTKSEIIIRVML